MFLDRYRECLSRVVEREQVVHDGRARLKCCVELVAIDALRHTKGAVHQASEIGRPGISLPGAVRTPSPISRRALWSAPA